MLYDPKWEQKTETKADPFSLDSLIAWLEKQPADIWYPWGNCRGECLFSQYLTHLGYPKDPCNEATIGPWAILHDRHYGLMHGQPHTFGAALERARSSRG